MTRGALVLFLVSVIFGFTAAYAGHGSYSLTPQKIADGVYVFWGRQEPPTSENGGNIVNTGFIVGTNSVLVVDTGPTQHYAKEMIAAIRNITKLPIHTAVVTHHHPDHSFGIQHFKKNNAATYMHRGLKTLFANEGPILLGFLESLIGENWITGTKIDKPSHLIETEQAIDIGGRIVKIFPLVDGHTPGDLLVYDQETQILFAGDLVFHDRAATVPHANIPVWLEHLDTIRDLGWRKLVPGHGPVVTDQAPIEGLKAYLTFLQQTTMESIERGDTLAEVLQATIPVPFDKLATVQSEFQRSMTTLFRKFEAEAFGTSISDY